MAETESVNAFVVACIELQKLARPGMVSLEPGTSDDEREDGPKMLGGASAWV